jgi:hypothetical protein
MCANVISTPCWYNTYIIILINKSIETNAQTVEQKNRDNNIKIYFRVGT